MDCSKKRSFITRRKSGPIRSLTENDDALIDQSFQLFDKDQRGIIDLRELKTAIRALGFPMKKKQLIEILEMHGRDREEPIDHETFQSIVRDLIIDQNPVDRVRQIFDKLDIDGTGKITARVLKRLSKQVGHPIDDEELDDMIDQFDGDGDNAIDFDDFRKILMDDENDTE